MVSLFTEPPLSRTSAHLLVAFFGLSYVGSIYASKQARLSFRPAAQAPPQPGQERTRVGSERGRDDPNVIRARLIAVSIATTLSCGAVFWTIWRLSGGTYESLPVAGEAAILRLGLQLPSFEAESIYPHLLTPILFLGPLFVDWLSKTLPFQSNWSYQTYVADVLNSWQGVRNYIVAPITEELVFRSCVLCVYHLAGLSRTKLIFLAPLSFGFAHVHHAWETYNRFGRTAAAAKRAVFTSLFQFGYTSLFGFYTSYLFLRTGSAYPAITAHIFCNFMGVPQLGYELSEFPDKRSAIYIAYIMGIFGFVWEFTAFTDTSNSLYWMKSGSGY